MPGSYVGDLGERLARLIRIYLTGRMAIEGTALVDESRFPGHLGRALFAVLGMSRGPVSRPRLADILWDASPPSTYESSLNPLVSKIRGLLVEAGADRDLVSASRGAVELRRLSDVSIDVEDATAALDSAEGAMRRGDPEQAWPKAAVATAVFRRPFLEGVDLSWAVEQRRALREKLIRGLEVATDVWLERDDPVQAVVAAAQLVEADPFRETSNERLIRAHTRAGNRAAALRVYSDCEQLLRQELGVEPSTLVQSAYEKALGLA